MLMFLSSSSQRRSAPGRLFWTAAWLSLLGSLRRCALYFPSEITLPCFIFWPLGNEPLVQPLISLLEWLKYIQEPCQFSQRGLKATKLLKTNECLMAHCCYRLPGQGANSGHPVMVFHLKPYNMAVSAFHPRLQCLHSNVNYQRKQWTAVRTPRSAAAEPLLFLYPAAVLELCPPSRLRRFPLGIGVG